MADRKIDLLINVHDRASKKLTGLVTQIGNIEKEMQSLKQTQNSLTSSSGNATEQFNEFSNTLTILGREIESVSSQQKSLQRSFEDINEETSRLSEYFANTSRTVKDFDSNIKKTKNSTSTVTREFENVNRTIGETQREVDNVTNSMNGYGRSTRRTAGYTSDMRDINKALNADLQDLTATEKERAERMQSVYRDVGDSFRKQRAQMLLNEADFYALSKATSQYGRRVTMLRQRAVELGRDYSDAQKRMIDNNKLFGMTLLRNMGHMMSMRSLADKAVTSMNDLHNPLYRFSRAGNNAVRAMDDLARQGNVTYNVIRTLGTDASMSQINEKIKDVNKTMGGLTMATIGSLIVFGALTAGFIYLARNIEPLPTAWANFKSAWMDALMPFLTMVAHIVAAILNFFTAIANFIRKLNEVNEHISILGFSFIWLLPLVFAFLTPISLMLAGLGGWAVAFAKVWNAIKAVAFVIGITIGPAMVLTAVIVGLVYAGYQLWQRSETLRASFQALQDAISRIGGYFSALGKYIWAIIVDGDELNDWITHMPDSWRTAVLEVGTIVDGLRTKVINAFNIVIEYLQGRLEYIRAFFEEHGAQIKQAWDNVWNLIVLGFVTFWNTITGVAESNGSVLAEHFRIVWEGIKMLIQGNIDQILGIIRLFATVLTGDWQGAWESLRMIAQGIWVALVGFFRATFIGSLLEQMGFFSSNAEATFNGAWAKIESGMIIARDRLMVVWNTLKTGAMTIFNALKTFWATWGDSIKNFFTTSWSTITTTLQTLWATLKSVAMTVFNTLKSFWQTWGSTIMSFLTNAWNNISSSLQSVWNALKSSATQIFNALMNFWQTWGQGIWQLLQNIWIVISNSLKSVWTSIKSFAMTIWNGLSAFWEQWGSKIMAFFSNLWSMTSSMFSSVFNSITELVVGIFNGLADFWDNWGGTITSFFTVLFGLITMIFSTAWSVIKNVVLIGLGALKALWDRWGDTIMSLVTRVWDIITTLISNAISVIKDVILLGLDIINGNWSSAWDRVKSILSSAWEIIKTTVSQGIGMIWDIIKQVGSEIWNIMKKTWNGVADAVSDGMDKAKKWATSKITDIKNFFAGIDLAKIGANIIKGLVNGITSIDVMSAVRGVAKSISGGFSRFFKEASPSRLMRDGTGKNITLGLSEGMLSEIRTVQRSAKKVSEATMTGFEKGGGLQASFTGGRTRVDQRITVRSDHRVRVEGEGANRLSERELANEVKNSFHESDIWNDLRQASRKK